MRPINLRLGNKSIGKSLIAALAPLLGRYHEARKSLRGSTSKQSRQGLDWMNFFLADVQTAFGAFVAFYLADLGWSKGQVGLALTVGTLAGVISQIPGGWLADAVRWKRGLAAIGIGMLCVSALILGLMPSFALVFFAEILHGLTAGIVTPAIAAISLGLVGRRAMSLRTGRNYRFNAAGNALTAGLMGLAGQYFAKSAIFLGAAALCIPALVALSRIRADEIDYARARNAGKGEQAKSYHRIFDLGRNRKLYIFAACVFLFQLADASLLPVVGQNLAQSETEYASLLMAGLIVVPQIVVALLSPWVGFYSEKWGRKPLLLLGFGLEIIRTMLFALSASVPILLTAQLWHQLCGRHRTHNPGDHRSDHWYRPIQLGTRGRRHPHRHRRFDQHHRNRIYFRGPRPLGRFSDPGGRFRHCHRVAMGGNAGDNAD